jgi:hypothetical protein
MTDYQAQAKQFLKDCNATMEIKYLCKSFPKWDSNLHNCYWFTITTPKGSYDSKFYDSLHNTEISEMTAEDFAKKKYKAHYQDLTMFHKRNVSRELKSLKANAKPTEYDVLACVEKYSYDSFSDFCSEFGFSTDSISARERFLACGEEYTGLRRIFTDEQMEKLREIY